VGLQTVIEHALSLIRDTYGFGQIVSGNGLPHVIEAKPLDRLGIGNWRLRNDWMERWRAARDRETDGQKGRSHGVHDRFARLDFSRCIASLLEPLLGDVLDLLIAEISDSTGKSSRSTDRHPRQS
jgi:hypothetical protein